MTMTGRAEGMIGFDALDALSVELLIALLIGLFSGNCGGGVAGT